jgi:Class II flagellar assembly regulator
MPASPLTLKMTYEAARDAVSADREARRHGRALLRALGAVQLALLLPNNEDEGGEARAQLARLAATPPTADDPTLCLILREIGVRAAIELARLDA